MKCLVFCGFPWYLPCNTECFQCSHTACPVIIPVIIIVPSFFFPSYLHHKTSTLHSKKLALLTHSTSDRLVQEYSLLWIWNFGDPLPAEDERKMLRRQQHLRRFTIKHIKAHSVFLDMLDGVSNNDSNDCWGLIVLAIYRMLQCLLLPNWTESILPPAVITTLSTIRYTQPTPY